MQLQQKDLDQIHLKGIEPEQIERQLGYFRKGFPYMQLIEPATINNGIRLIDPEELETLIAEFDQRKHDYDILKFVPASGAASRMFKHLYEFSQSFQETSAEVESIMSQTDFGSVGYFLQHIKRFAFYDDLKAVIASAGEDLNQLLETGKLGRVVDYLISERGLNYGSLPKALLKFHWYPDHSRLALEEHLVEAAVYAEGQDKVAKLHFTISPEHKARFLQVLDELKPYYESKLGVRFVISFSEQKSSTDTIAVDMQNQPFRNDDGTLLFRPGGHGALIENLNDLNEEIIFIKNIDNIVPDRLRSTTYQYKKAIGALLIKLQEQTFEYLDQLDSGLMDENELEAIAAFARNELMINIPIAFEAYDFMEKVDYLFTQLNRPMRICGMVKNEGEPGGGPFWVLSPEGVKSLQIVESSQIDMSDPAQAAIVKSATHFNPVDLVCGVYNFRGEKFDLTDFVDQNTGFISTKFKDGRALKALELPGLWNGAMSDWITIFVETPLITFNPVKTVNDLLRPQHQPE
ncbi:MAG TPA: DUF4301 family protein [Bacteroidales bacterium]|nr:DUF4301 family protein [Bacteroidales bacterium]